MNKLENIHKLLKIIHENMDIKENLIYLQMILQRC